MLRNILREVPPSGCRSRSVGDAVGGRDAISWHARAPPTRAEPAHGVLRMHRLRRRRWRTGRVRRTLLTSPVLYEFDAVDALVQRLAARCSRAGATRATGLPALRATPMNPAAISRCPCSARCSGRTSPGWAATETSSALARNRCPVQVIDVRGSRVLALRTRGSGPSTRVAPRARTSWSGTSVRKRRSAGR